MHYWSRDCTSGHDRHAWNAFTGSTGGWTDWTVDLSAYAGKKIDIRVSVITDWATLGLGRLDRRLRLTDGATTIEFNDFEADTGGWTDRPAAAGTDNLTNGWTRRTKEFQEGGVVTTNDTVYTGLRLRGHQRGVAQRVHEAHADASSACSAPRAAFEHRHGHRRRDGRTGPRR